MKKKKKPVRKKENKKSIWSAYVTSHRALREMARAKNTRKKNQEKCGGKRKRKNKEKTPEKKKKR